jgi:hypothetical protein
MTTGTFKDASETFAVRTEGTSAGWNPAERLNQAVVSNIELQSQTELPFQSLHVWIGFISPLPRVIKRQQSLYIGHLSAIITETSLSR